MLVNGKVLVGNNKKLLESLPDSYVQCVVTSPPYWGLRDYGTADWIGGDPDCSHRRETKKSDKTITGHKNFDDMLGVSDAIYKDVCQRCGAKREDEQLGLELTPEDYVKQLADVFDEIWRVLKDDGTVWLNIGDSYAGSGKGPAGNLGSNHNERHMEHAHSAIVPEGLKQKDLVGIPWRVAFELQKRGWYLRSDIIWHKPNPMPESVKDRPTKSHEYIFLLTKSDKYFYDYLAIREPGVIPAGTKGAKGSEERSSMDKVNSRPPEYKIYDGYRNKRDVWSVATKPYKEAHFAVYPVALVEPCVLAGTSSHGECVNCGVAWRPTVQKDEETGGTTAGPFVKGCKCETSDVRPQVVLDPFSGSGTTGLVALENGRNYLGLELNPDYAEISRKRLSDALGMMAEIEVV